jgi:hypothetical protein
MRAKLAARRTAPQKLDPSESTTKYWAFVPKSELPSERRSMSDVELHSSFSGPGDQEGRCRLRLSYPV